MAAETAAIAEQALALIDVEYEALPVLLDPAQAMEPGAPILHDEAEYVNFAESDPSRNLAAHIRIDIGDVEKGFSQADYIFEDEYEVPKVQQAHIEPHVVITYWDEDDRLVIRTSTQVPFHVRRILSPVLNLPIKRISGDQTTDWGWFWWQARGIDRRCGGSSHDRNWTTCFL